MRTQRRLLIRKSILWACLGLLVLLCVEGTAWLLYWFLQGRPYSSKRINREIRLVVENPRKQLLSAVREKGQKEVQLFEAGTLNLHPYLGFAYDPARTRSQGIPINDLGFLGPVPIGARTQKEVRIGIFGGSVAVALWVFGRDTLVKELAASPQFGANDLRVYSFAAPGSKQPQQVLALSYLKTLGVDVDIVISLDGFNEIALPPVHNLPDAPSWYPRGWIQYARAATSDSHLLDRVAAWQYFRRTVAETLLRSPATSSPTLGLTWTLLDRAFANRVTTVAREVETALKTSTTKSSSASFAYASDNDMYRALAGLWADSARLAANLVTCTGGTYYVVLQPNQYVVGSKKLTETERARAYAADHPYRRHAERGYPYLREAGERLRHDGIGYLDLTGLFATTSEEIYADTCCHYWPHGYEAIARAIAQRIISDTKGKPASAHASTTSPRRLCRPS